MARGIAYPRPGMSTAPLWPDDDVSRVPYRVYTDPDLHAREQERIFRGPTWNFLCLEAEIPEPGDYKTCFVGDASIIAVRDAAGGINALVNRCAHKGALVCYKPRGRVDEFACVYHNWTYDLAGNLTGVAFGRGVRGEGGMEAGFEPASHGLRRLRVAARNGLVFATFSDDAPELETYIGPAMLAALDRVFVKPVRVLGYHSQVLPNNWKLYMENTKDSYHATLLPCVPQHIRDRPIHHGRGHRAQRERLAPSELHRALGRRQRRGWRRGGALAQGAVRARGSVADGTPAGTRRTGSPTASRRSSRPWSCSRS